MNIHDVTWYYYLKKDNKLIFDRNNFIVSMDWSNDDKLTKIFSSFIDYIHFYNYMNKFHEKHFYEVIMGKQKPHFDIDGGNITEELLNAIIDSLCVAIKKVLTNLNYNIDNKQLLVYKSTNSEKKKSSHVVVNGLYHDNNKEAKYFYNLVIEHVQDEYKPYIDPAVYSSCQQFRILGSSKLNTDRVKYLVLTDELSEYYNSKNNYKDIEIFKDSLITFVNTSTYLNVKYKETPKKIVTTNIDPDEIENILNILNDKLKYSLEFRDYNNGVITLLDKNRYNCILCKRIHEHENPYIIINNNKVYFCCRRAQAENREYKYFLCNLVDKDELKEVQPKKEYETIEKKYEISYDEESIDIFSNNFRKNAIMNRK